MSRDEEDEIEAIVQSIKASKKYRQTNAETIRQIALTEYPRYKNGREVEKAVRKRLHKIVAPFLGDPDYGKAIASLGEAFSSGDPEVVKETCAVILSSHVSTRERLPILEEFYSRIFDLTGKPSRLLDIACALNPLSYPWTGLPTTLRYEAYDIHEERVDFLNDYFALQGLKGVARVQDIAFQFPGEEGEIAFFLKELHRFEENYPGIGLPLLEALRVRFLVVSFPTVSLHGGRPLTALYRRFFQGLIAAKNWRVEELLFPNELVFCVEKGDTQ